MREVSSVGKIFLNVARSARSASLFDAFARAHYVGTFMANIDRISPQSDAPAFPKAERVLLAPCVLACLGAWISILLLQKHSGGHALFCPVGAGCDAVLSSKYSAVFGIPLPWFGIAFYFTLLAMGLCAYGVRSNPVRARLLGGMLWLAVMGVSFSAALMFIQFKLLHAFCPLCTASALVVALLVFAAGRAEKIAGKVEFAGRGFSAIALGIFALVPAVLQTASAISTQSEAVAIVDGETFTRTQMEEELGVALQPLQRSIHELEFDWVRGKVDAALLAAETKRSGKDAAASLAAQISAVKPPTESEIDARLSGKGLDHTPENAVKAGEELLAENRERTRVEFLSELAKGHRIDVLLKPPRVTALQIDLATANISGPRDARVQLVVFSDFQCHFCRELASVLKRARAEFPNDVMVAYRYFPIEEHERALPAAIAAECASEQGAFWEYHDNLYAGGDLGDATLTAIAVALGLNEGRFAECRNSGRARAVVEASRANAAASGLEGAPALFLNGKRIGGMIDYDRLATRIREALRISSKPANISQDRPIQ